MLFNYKLHSISYPYYIYKVYLNDSVFTLEIDLIQDYPNYEYVHNHYNNQDWYYVLSKSNDKLSVKGEIITVKGMDGDMYFVMCSIKGRATSKCSGRDPGKMASPDCCSVGYGVSPDAIKLYCFDCWII